MSLRDFFTMKEVEDQQGIDDSSSTSKYHRNNVSDSTHAVIIYSILLQHMQESSDYYVCISTFVTKTIGVLCYLHRHAVAVANSSSSTEGHDIEN